MEKRSKMNSIGIKSVFGVLNGSLQKQIDLQHKSLCNKLIEELDKLGNETK